LPPSSLTLLLAPLPLLHRLRIDSRRCRFMAERERGAVRRPLFVSRLARDYGVGDLERAARAAVADDRVTVGSDRNRGVDPRRVERARRVVRAAGRGGAEGGREAASGEGVGGAAGSVVFG